MSQISFYYEFFSIGVSLTYCLSPLGLHAVDLQAPCYAIIGLKVLSSHKRGGGGKEVYLDLPSYNIADVFQVYLKKGLLSCFKFQNTGYCVQGLKEVESFLCGVRQQKLRSTLWPCATFIELANRCLEHRSEKKIVTSGYSPCNNTPPAEPQLLRQGQQSYERVPQGGVRKQKIIFQKISRAISVVVTGAAAAEGVSAHELYHEVTMRF